MGDPAPLHEHAIDNLRYIRRAMEKAGAFTSIPGWGGFLIGLTAITTTVIAQRWTRGDGGKWLATWLIEACLAALIGAGSMWIKVRRSGHPFRTTATRRFFVSYGAPVLSAALLTIVCARSGYYELLPALWLLSYGSAFISSGTFSIRVIPVMGVAFLLFGVAACIVALPAGNILLGLGFGGLHAVFGLIIARSYGG
jgi:hypothetical protein